jgi:hypothetical protein
MLESAPWGFVGGFALIVGAVAGLRIGASQRVIGLVMAFGSGVLISALAFELTDEAFERGGADAVALGSRRARWRSSPATGSSTSAAASIASAPAASRRAAPRRRSWSGRCSTASPSPWRSA